MHVSQIYSSSATLVYAVVDTTHAPIIYESGQRTEADIIQQM